MAYVIYKCPICKRVFPCEAGQKEVICTRCGKKINNARSHPAQYSNKPWPRFLKRRPIRIYDPGPWHRPRKEIYRPNPGRTIMEPANFRVSEPATPTLLQPEPSDTQPVETKMGKLEAINQGMDEFIHFFEKNAILIALGLTALAIAGGIISANTSSGTSGSSSDKCAEVYSKIRSVSDCSSSDGTGATKSGYKWCYVVTYDGSPGHGWIPNGCF